MNPKVMQMLEKHVEKIVLAVAGAGAIYLGILAIKPVTIEGHDDVQIDQVESKIAELIEKMKQTEKANSELGPVTAPIPAYAETYRKLIETQPLKPELVNVSVPQFGPPNLAVRTGPIPGSPDLQQMQVVTPAPLPPESVTADVWQQQVAALPKVTPGASAVTPPAPLAMSDKNAVLVQGYIPVAKMLAELNSQKIQANPANNKRLPDGLRRVSIYRIEVERSERTGTGWTDFKAVPMSKGSAQPTDIPWQAIPNDQAELQTRMDQVDSEFKQIVIPDFYVDAQGQPIQAPILTQPLSKPLIERSRVLQEGLNAANGIPTAATPIAPSPTSPETPEGAAPAMTADVAAIRSLPLVPFNAWDETVEAGHQYQYRVRIAYVNPTFNWQHGLANSAMKAKPLLYSDYVTISGQITVNPDVAFFVMGPGLTAKLSQHVAVRVFKRTNGKWYWGEFDVQPGLGIAGSIPVVDEGDRRMDVDTGYTVVDVVSSGNDSHVVLIDSAGTLSTRDSSADRADEQNKKLFESVIHRPVTTAPAPTTRTGPMRGTPPRVPGTPG